LNGKDREAGRTCDIAAWLRRASLRSVMAAASGPASKDLTAYIP